MLKKAFSVSLSVIVLISLFMISPVYGLSEDVTEYDAVEVMKIMSNTVLTDLKAKGAILTDCNTGTILLEKNSHEKLPIASVTKIMSMLLIMESIDAGVVSYDTKVTVSEYSWSFGGSQVWLEPGEVFTVDELLKAVAIHSANDATVALAEAIAGSEETFVAMMNQKAKELGMNDTNFLDCSGLTDVGHYSSAYDIAVMSRELLLKHPEITEYTSTWQAKFRDNVPGKKAVSLDNTNKLVRHYKGTVGLKTGYTGAAGHCLSASAVRNGQQLISVVLGEPDSNTRFAESRKLLDYGFANFETVMVNTKDEPVQQVVVKKGLQPVTNAVYKKDVNLLLKKGEKGKIERIAVLQENLTAPVKSGQKIGEVKYVIAGNEVGKADLVASSDVQRVSFLRIMYRLMQEWFCMGRTAV
ncbi:MAG: D-alanyl-D-alanine carboxypeptidase [Clostridiaceae bacterium]|jgi:D-alanyl-D-alanine carboxypeptidase (penicillin-binding protein 5/6)|nr:D-alanyl-D-alanine carboxypeptidase [Clostridiaceae bacterium]